MADKKKVIVTECVAGFTGINKNGNEYTIYDVKANAEDGSPIDLTLRSFDDLPLGPGEYEVETYSKDGKTSYTLKGGPRRPAGGGIAASEFNALAARVTALEQRAGLAGSDVTPASAAPAGGWPQPTATRPDDTDDIPF